MSIRHWLNRTRVPGLALTALIVLGAAASSADAQVVRVDRSDAKHSVGGTLGYFAVKGVDSRVDGDVLLADLSDLAFLVKDFNGFTASGEYLYGIGKFVEAGGSIGYYQRTVPSVYADFVNTNGSEIAQDLKLRVLPITGTVRFIPTGRGSAVQPYVGGGVGFFRWKYSEIGDFVDFSDGSVFNNLNDENLFRADGWAVGPVALFGVKFPIGDAFTTGVEFRWQKAEGDTKPAESELLGDKIDLGGWTTSWTMHLRF